MGTKVAADAAPAADPARVSRSSAIWVAVITAIGGFATAVASGSLGLLKQSQPPPPAPVQRWIRIESVQLGSHKDLPPIDRVRLIVQVNGVSYAYPTSVHSLWTPVGPGMAAERYPLPVGTDTYRVRFYGFGYVSEARIPRYESRDAAEIQPRQIPLRGASQALRLTGSTPSGLVTGMTVKYSIE
jgi:hypothetical protein